MVMLCYHLCNHSLVGVQSYELGLSKHSEQRVQTEERNRYSHSCLLCFSLSVPSKYKDQTKIFHIHCDLILAKFTLNLDAHQVVEAFSSPMQQETFI